MASFFFILWVFASASGQTPCEWKQITNISNKTLNDPKINRGIREKTDVKTQSLSFGADTSLKDIVFTDDRNGWIVGGKDIVLQTTNSGLSWKTKNLSLDEVNGVFFLDKQNGWVVGRSRSKLAVYKTKNSGIVWKLSQPIQQYELSSSSRIGFADSRIGWMTGYVERPESNTVILKTADGGKNWKIQHSESLESGGSTYFSDIEVIDENNVIAIGDRSIVKTNDGGKTWRNIYNSARSYSFSDIEFVNKNEGWIVAARGDILFTKDGGESWEDRKNSAVESKSEMAYTTVKFITPQKGWISGWSKDLSDNGFIFATNNGGKTWTVETKRKNWIISRMTATSNAVFAVGVDGLILRRSLNCQ